MGGRVGAVVSCCAAGPSAFWFNKESGGSGCQWLFPWAMGPAAQGAVETCSYASCNVCGCGESCQERQQTSDSLSGSQG